VILLYCDLAFTKKKKQEKLLQMNENIVLFEMWDITVEVVKLIPRNQFTL